MKYVWVTTSRGARRRMSQEKAETYVEKFGGEINFVIEAEDTDAPVEDGENDESESGESSQTSNQE